MLPGAHGKLRRALGPSMPRVGVRGLGITVMKVENGLITDVLGIDDGVTGCGSWASSRGGVADTDLRPSPSPTIRANCSPHATPARYREAMATPAVR
jgi:hypothetical protein